MNRMANNNLFKLVKNIKNQKKIVKNIKNQ